MRAGQREGACSSGRRSPVARRSWPWQVWQAVGNPAATWFGSRVPVVVGAVAGEAVGRRAGVAVAVAVGAAIVRDARPSSGKLERRRGRRRPAPSAVVVWQLSQVVGKPGRGVVGIAGAVVVGAMAGDAVARRAGVAAARGSPRSRSSGARRSSGKPVVAWSKVAPSQRRGRVAVLAGGREAGRGVVRIARPLVVGAVAGVSSRAACRCSRSCGSRRRRSCGARRRAGSRTGRGRSVAVVPGGRRCGSSGRLVEKPAATWFGSRSPLVVGAMAGVAVGAACPR